jgi:hypothetical protein
MKLVEIPMMEPSIDAGWKFLIGEDPYKSDKFPYWCLEFLNTYEWMPSGTYPWILWRVDNENDIDEKNQREIICYQQPVGSKLSPLENIMTIQEWRNEQLKKLGI